MDLSGFRLLDSHCHPIWREDPPELSAAFTEAHDPRFARDGLFYRRSLKDLSRFLACSPEEVPERRRALPREDLFARCVEGLDELLLDDGLTPDRCHSLAWHARHVKARRLLRIEQVAESLYAGQTWPAFRDRFVRELEAAEVAGFKSIAAYRTGLDIDPEADGAAAYAGWRGERLARKPLNDHLVRLTLERGRPVQFHTGFGDPDLDLRTSNPLCLRPLIERYPTTPVVLLHAGYPFAREAGFLASVYPNVYLDFGLAVPFLSVAGMRRAVSELLELGPLTKLTWSSDASRIPELYYLGSLWGRRVLGDVLDECVRDGDLSAQEAEEAASGILRDTAAQLYA